MNSCPYRDHSPRDFGIASVPAKRLGNAAVTQKHYGDFLMFIQVSAQTLRRNKEGTAQETG